MKSRWKLFLGLAVALLLLVGAGATWLSACLDPETSIVFTWERHPDLPLASFAAGRIGLPQPYYARSYLVVAYRCLMDQPLAPAEQKEAMDLWERRLNGFGGNWFLQDELKENPGPSFLGTPTPEAEADDLQPEAVWLKARKTFMQGPPPAVKGEDQYWSGETWFKSIQDGAFRSALQTLRARAALWGWKDGRLRAWIKAQDQVFASSRAKPSIPGPLGPQADPLLRLDRSYQIAAATFYAQRYDEAIRAFEAIAADPASPWSKTASYLIARCWYRKGKALEGDHRKEAVEAYGLALAAAERVPAHPQAHLLGMALRWDGKRAQALLQAEAPDDFDFDARYLAKAAAAEKDPPERTLELAGLLGRIAGTPDFGVDLGDYTILLDRQSTGEADWDDYHHSTWSGRIPPKAPRQLPAALMEDDLTDWVFSFRETGKPAFQHALARWRTKPTNPWLLAALANAEASSDGLGPLMAAAAAIPRDHAGYPMAAFHLARLLLAQHQQDQARTLLDGLAAMGDRLGPSALNLVKALRLPMARSPEELVLDLQRGVTGIEYPQDERPQPEQPDNNDLGLIAQWGVAKGHPACERFLRAYGPGPAFLQADGASILNLGVPTKVLAGLAELPTTPAHLRREWLRCAWVRAVLLEDYPLALVLTPRVQAVEPELQGPLAAFLAAPVLERRHQAILVLLRHPGLRWYVSQSLGSRTYQPARHTKDGWPLGFRLQDRQPFRDSFWPDLKELQEIQGPDNPSWYSQQNPFQYEGSLTLVFGKERAGRPGFLSGADRAQLDLEVKRLQDLEAGPAWLCREVLAWARIDPSAPAMPEALHLAVRATRIGGATELSRQCFRLLHANYKGSEWAGRTPYYF